ncbi:gliding motility lipoprotein GldB [Wenyingzhuangia sp. IMCC45574]
MKNWSCLLLVSFLIFSCSDTSKTEVEINKTKVAVDFALFHDALFTSKAEDLPDLKMKYPYMFPVSMPDSIVVNRMKDTAQYFLYKEVKKVYGDFSSQKKELEDLFKHIKFYNKEFVPPIVVTDLTGVSYQDRVLYAGDLLLISLEMYLGKEHPIYDGFSMYLSETFTPKHLTTAVAKKIIDTQYSFDENRTFLGQLIFEGKKLYLLDLYLPLVANEVKLGYTPEKYQWALSNEADVWSYFIKNDLLFSTDPSLKERFIDLAPFSKFFTTADMSSPGSIGKYIGWQIVSAYAKNNKVSVNELMEIDAEEILNKSKFKPKKY